MTDAQDEQPAEVCDICEAPAVGLFQLELDFDPFTEPDIIEEWGTIFELLVCAECVKSPSMTQTICELASEENAPSNYGESPPSSLLLIGEQLLALSGEQRAQLIHSLLKLQVPRPLLNAVRAYLKLPPLGPG